MVHNDPNPVNSADDFTQIDFFVIRFQKAFQANRIVIALVNIEPREPK